MRVGRSWDRCVELGIESEQILHYLRSHSLGSRFRDAKERHSETPAHLPSSSQVHLSPPPPECCHPVHLLQPSATLPPSVSDQIRLWELERDRFTFTPVSVRHPILPCAPEHGVGRGRRSRCTATSRARRTLRSSESSPPVAALWSGRTPTRASSSYPRKVSLVHFLPLYICQYRLSGHDEVRQFWNAHQQGKS